MGIALIRVAYGALAVAVAIFTVIIRWIRPDIGTVITAVVILGIACTIAGVVLLSGSALGTVALLKDGTLRRPIAVATVLAGWLGGSVVGWMAWSFWARS